MFAWASKSWMSLRKATGAVNVQPFSIAAYCNPGAGQTGAPSCTSPLCILALSYCNPALPPNTHLFWGVSTACNPHHTLATIRDGVRKSNTKRETRDIIWLSRLASPWAAAPLWCFFICCLRLMALEKQINQRWHSYWCLTFFHQNGWRREEWPQSDILTKLDVSAANLHSSRLRKKKNANSRKTKIVLIKNVGLQKH